MSGIDKRHRAIPKTYRLKVILTIISIGGLILGMETSSMPIFVSSDYFNNYFNNPSSVAQGLIAGSNPGGAFCKLKPF